ncbi:ankyrin repeat domain-containing protein 27-like isoform X1 [Trichogramma pretiosum]|uniref:ankyrin repeat domain-containing protein 27-like isoform X1 n=2 Tax=Trichogramma pretiosum TaxID=7493 RepID=UPI000C71BAE8|nr:ankyrin repeat domain-containing protein 27-like isoform X1 [Trichogramma pretiosum]
MCRDAVESSLGCLFAPTTSLYHSFLRYRRGLRRRRARHDRHRCYQCRRKYHWSLFREQQLRDDTDHDNELDQFGRHVAAADDARLSCINHLLLRISGRREALLDRDTWLDGIMDSNYDEDLSENAFYRTLQQEYQPIFDRAIREGWTICVPRSGTFTKDALTEEDFLGHILVPDDELPATHFHTLTDREVRLCNRALVLEYETAKPVTLKLLFEETFYTEDINKYTVWCIEGLLEQDSGFCSNEVPVVNSLKDCIDLLWSEVHDKSVLKEMELAIEDFEKGHKSLDKECLQMQRDLVSMLYAKSLRILMKDSRLRERTIESRYFLQTIKIAIESFVLHGLRKLLPQAVALSTAHEDATLNKLIKNLYDLQLKDLSVRPDLYDGVNRGKQELSRLEGHFTVLGKLGCLKRAVRLVSQGESSVSSDDLLPVLIFLVVKSGLASWCAQLAFMKNFRYSASAGHESDEAGFLVTSLEAAVEHVKSGSLRLGNGNEEDLTEHGPKLNGQSSIPIYENINGDEDHNLFGNGYGDCNGLDKQTSELFEHARKGNVVEVQRIMTEKSSSGNNDKESKLCHPLCLCERCQRKMSSNKRFGLDGTPSITARDERGRTCLHVAALHGQVAVVDYLLNRGAKTSLADADGATALHCAAARGHQNTLLMLLHAGADPNAQDSRGNTPLHLAADHGHDACVKTLLFFGEHSRMPISVSATNVQGDTALHFASKWGYSGIVELLMEHGADVQARNRRGQTPMTLAHSNLVAKLLEAQPSMKKCSTLGCNGTIHKETGTKKRTTQANNTMKPGASTTKKHGFKYSYRGGGLTEGMHKIDRLFAAVAEGDIRLASYYLGLEGPLSKTFVTEHDSPKFCHPLCNCDKCVSIEELAYERENKPPVAINAINSRGETALHIAAGVGCIEIIQLLLDAGAHVNLPTRSEGRTPLHLACQNEHPSAVKLLLASANCNPDAKDHSRDTPLHLAARSGSVRIVEMLVRHGANFKLRNINGMTALDEVDRMHSDDIFFSLALTNIGKILRNVAGNSSTGEASR